MLTLLYSLLEGSAITIPQQIMAWITLAIDLISSVYLVWHMIKSRKMKPEQIVKLIKKNVKGNDLSKIANDLVNELMEEEEKKDE